MHTDINSLSGAALDWAVAYTQVKPFLDGKIVLQGDMASTALRNGFRIHDDPAATLRLMQEHGIAVRRNQEGIWQAMSQLDAGNGRSTDWAAFTEVRARHHFAYPGSIEPRRQCFTGDTLIEAVLRAFVGATFPWGLDVPDRLLSPTPASEPEATS